MITREKFSVKFWQVGLIVIYLFMSFNPSLAATQTALKKFNIGYTVVLPDYGPLWIANDAGFFNAQGLDAQAVLLRGATVTLQALVAGDVPLVGASGPTLINSNLRGIETTIIATLANRFPHSLFSHSRIKSVLELKGKKIAVDSITGSAMFATRISLKKFGLDPDKDVTYILGGTPDTRLALLKVGVVDATVLVLPETLAARKLGFNMLLDMSDVDVPYQSSGIGALKSFVQSNRETVISVMKAIVQAIHFLKTNKGGTLRIYAKYLRLNDPELLEEAYNSSKKRSISKPYPDQAGIKTILEDHQLPEAKSALPTRFFDRSIVGEIDDSGFIEKLYGDPR